MSNYSKIAQKYIEEIKTNVSIFRHNKSNARICIMDNDDINKVFSIAFRTPPMDDSGLTHILEHSVLCGSKKYPVKDPFVELLKSSLNTFLNAFTFPDKTMYPCASVNDKDFKNLISVYMDAVFYPQIYNHEEIFMQEGWHYHILDEKDDLTYNGVVYNEMKGAFSNPEQVLIRNIMHSLYPDNQYRFESGGNPKFIPSLSYEKFLDFHKKYYHPSNSYIYIYGKCDFDAIMDFLDKEYLSNFNAIEFDTKINYQTPFLTPTYQTSYYPISLEEDKKDKTFLSYNVVLPTTLDIKLMIAINILIKVLFENPGAIVKEALIDSKLGQDVQVLFDDSLLQPLLSIIVYNSNEELEEKFIEVINNSFDNLIKNGLDKESLLSVINYQEFKCREQGFSSRMPKGLLLEMTSLSSWLYDDNDPFSKLESLKYYTELRKDMENGYFETIIDKYLLNNGHKSFVKLIPSHQRKSEEDKEISLQLEKVKKALSKEELTNLIEKNKNLIKYQSTPSTKVEIDTLPKLKIEDISPDPIRYNTTPLSGEYKTLFTDASINDIQYVKYYFDISNISRDDLQYLQLFSDLLMHLSTSSYNYKELNKMILNYSGGIRSQVLCLNTYDKKPKIYLQFKYSALNKNIKLVHDLLTDIINNTIFTDSKKLGERLKEIKLNLEMGISDRGHSFALLRASSYCDENSANLDAISGIGYFDFLTKIDKNYQSEYDILLSRLQEVSHKILSKKRFILGYLGDKSRFLENKNIFDSYFNTLNDYDIAKNKAQLNKLNEGIKTQYDVNFVARAGHYTKAFNGSMLVLSNALNLDYLWQKVRVLGGAYGCMLSIRTSGMIGMTSYRDPNISKTNQVYEDIISYIENINFTDEELLKYKIGAVGALDPVMHISEGANLAEQYILTGITYEILKQQRKELLDASNEDLKNLANCFKEALGENNLCVIGNQNKIEENKDLFMNIRYLNKGEAE